MTLTVQTEKSSLKDSLRQQTLRAAKQHKASWVELGQYLHTVFKDKHYRDWGFMSFEAYCMKELGIKQATASKLLKSYHFLEKEEPRLADARLSDEAGPKLFPSYESVNLLRLAKENKKLTPHDYADLREAVVEEAKEPKEIRAQVKKILSEREEKDPREVKRNRRNSLIKRLASLLLSAHREFQSERLLPGSILKQLAELARELEGQIE